MPTSWPHPKTNALIAHAVHRIARVIVIRRNAWILRLSFAMAPTRSSSLGRAGSDYHDTISARDATNTGQACCIGCGMDAGADCQAVGRRSSAARLVAGVQPAALAPAHAQ
jgi:hypothetical protein